MKRIFTLAALLLCFFLTPIKTHADDTRLNIRCIEMLCADLQHLLPYKAKAVTLEAVQYNTLSRTVSVALRLHRFEEEIASASEAELRKISDEYVELMLDGYRYVTGHPYSMNAKIDPMIYFAMGKILFQMEAADVKLELIYINPSKGRTADTETTITFPVDTLVSSFILPQVDTVTTESPAAE